MVWLPESRLGELDSSTYLCYLTETDSDIHAILIHMGSNASKIQSITKEPSITYKKSQPTETPWYLIQEISPTADFHLNPVAP